MALVIEGVTTGELFELNRSVRKLLEVLLQEKLEYAICGDKKCEKDIFCKEHEMEEE